MGKAKPSPVNLLREFSIPLITGVVAALVWANVRPDGYHAFVGRVWWGAVDLHFLVNEVFMAIFFGIAAVEITDSLAPGGSLNPPAKAVTPLFATVGGVLGPVGVYFLLNGLFGGPELARGWGIGTATDIALAWLVARMVFGTAHPAISFLLLLAIADDAIGLAIIAVFYPDPKHPVFLPWLGLVAAAMACGFGLRRARVKSYWPYLAVGGLSWAGLYLAHLHPALALVFVVPFMPHRRRPAGTSVFDVPAEGAGAANAGGNSTLIRFEHEWKVIVDFGLFFFGLANAGVEFSAVGEVTWIVMASLLVGKTVGIFGLGLAARGMGFALPAGMKLWDLLLVAVIAGLGLTVALFVAGAAFEDKHIEAAAKMGALGSVLAGPAALVMARVRRATGVAKSHQ